MSHVRIHTYNWRGVTCHYPFCHNCQGEVLHPYQSRGRGPFALSRSGDVNLSRHVAPTFRHRGPQILILNTVDAQPAFERLARGTRYFAEVFHLLPPPVAFWLHLGPTNSNLNRPFAFFKWLELNETSCFRRLTENGAMGSNPVGDRSACVYHLCLPFHLEMSAFVKKCARMGRRLEARGNQKNGSLSLNSRLRSNIENFKARFSKPVVSLFCFPRI